MSTSSIPQELLRTMLPRETAVAQRLVAGETIEAIAAHYDVEPATIQQIKTDVQSKITAWVKSDIRNALPFLQYKPDGTPRTRAERLAVLEEHIALATATGKPGGSGYTAAEFDAVMFPAAPSARDMN